MGLAKALLPVVSASCLKLVVFELPPLKLVEISSLWTWNFSFHSEKETLLTRNSKNLIKFEPFYSFVLLLTLLNLYFVILLELFNLLDFAKVLTLCSFNDTDPYLNTDAGTMSPFEHGEVFVLDDGGEVFLF